MLKRLLTALLTYVLISAVYAADSNVRLNSIGFIPSGAKGVTVNQAATTFEVRNSSGGALVHTGSFGGAINATDSGETLYKGDFSSFTTPGTYYVRAYNGGTPVGNSVTFTIADDVYNQPYITAMRAMYLWRCGAAVDGWYNGNHYTHAACHMNDGYLDEVTGAHTIKDGKGGWHDAGDYGKYTVNAGITVGMMFMAWEHFGSVLNNIPLSIPDTAPGYPEYLKEMKWEIDYVLKMVYPDGTGRVSHKLTRYNFAGFVMPENDTAERYFTDWGSAATADYVAMLAMAARIFWPYDKPYAEQCLAAAWVSYNFLLANTANKAPDLTGFTTGGYGTTDSDDRLWAAAEMWATTGSTVAKNDLDARANNYTDKTDADFDWSNVKNLGMYTYLMCTRTGKNTAIVNDIQNDLLTDANTIVTNRNNHGYARPLGTNYYWGCNGSVARQTMLLSIANMVSPNTNYTDAALDALGHLFGRNYFRRSFVTGMGDSPPMLPHDRRSGADGITDPWPGYLVGGSPGNGADPDLAAAVPAGQPAARYWADIEGSYSSNEIAINWQGALIYGLAAFCKNPATPTHTPTNTLTFTVTHTWTGTPPTATQTFTPTNTPAVGFVGAECATGTTFTIDGSLNEASWSSGTWTSVTRVVEGTQGAVSARFKVKWNSSGILVGVEVTDPVLCNANATWYYDDSVEVYIDANNNHSASYASDDYQYTIRYGDATLRVMPTALHPAANYSAATASIAGGYSAEFLLPWTDMGLSASAGLSIGFDVAVNHDETCGGTRTGVLMWNGTGNNWTNTSAFGDLGTNACINTPTETATASNTRTFTRTATSTSTSTATPTHTRTFTATNTDTATATNTRTATNTETATVMPTDTSTPTYSPSQTPSDTATNTPADTSTFTATETETRTYTVTYTPTETSTVPPGSTETHTPTITDTPQDTATFTATATGTPTDTRTLTATPTNTDTMTYTATSTATQTDTVPVVNTYTRTHTPANTFTFTPTATGTSTSAPFTGTHTPTATHTATSTLPFSTLTYTYTLTATYTYTRTATPTQTAHVLLPTSTPTEADEFAIAGPITVFPHPVIEKTGIYIRINLTKKAESVRMKIYTAAFRAVADVRLGSGSPAGECTLMISRPYLESLARGTYYYVIEAERGGQKARTGLQKLIIME